MLTPKLVKATLSDYPILQNMARFYVYEMARYCKEGWEFPEDGLYESIDYKHYFEDSSCHNFLIRMGEELAGFVLVNKIGSTADVDWNIAQFFIASRFQKKGIGRKIAGEIFSQFKGIWEVRVIPENEGAYRFWHPVIAQYSKGHFTQEHKMMTDHEPAYPMIVFKFKSPPDVKATPIKLVVEYHLTKENDSFVQKQLFDYETKELYKEVPEHFSIYIKEGDNDIKGGALVWVHRESIYIQTFWVDKALREQGYGTQLLTMAEEEGRKRGCRYATLDSNYQAVDFYLKNGYTLLGEIKNYIFEHSKVYLRKNLE